MHAPAAGACGPLPPRPLDPCVEQSTGEPEQRHVEPVQPAHGCQLGVTHRLPAGVRAVQLDEATPEPNPGERALEQQLRVGLALGQPEERHLPEVVGGAAEEDALALGAVGHGGAVVAADQRQVGQHARQPVVGEVVRTRHELLQRHARPVRPCTNRTITSPP